MKEFCPDDGRTYHRQRVAWIESGRIALDILRERDGNRIRTVHRSLWPRAYCDIVSNGMRLATLSEDFDDLETEGRNYTSTSAQ